MGYKGVVGLFLDFSKAFDLVDHDIMLRKLKYYGIVGKEYHIFQSYFKNRKQYVQINDVKSDILDIKCGVPQGSCLGPLLFTIYLNDLYNLNLNGHLYMFADDVSLFYPYKHEIALKTRMERDVSLIFEYARINRLVLNEEKTKLVRFRPNSNPSNEVFNIYVNGQIISETESVKYLGIILQSNLHWNLQICEVKRKIAPAVGILYKLRKKLNNRTMRLLYHALIQSHLNYMIMLYGYKNTTVLKSLQTVQNRALKIIFKLPVRHSTNLLFKDICWPIMPIHILHIYQVLVYIYKALNHIGYHTISFQQNQIAFNTRNQLNLRMPRCRTETSKQRIEYMGILRYNQLPSTLKTLNRISNFKSNLKEYLLQNLELLT